MNDKDIIQGILRKDTSALNNLIDKYGSIIYNVIASVLNGSHENSSIDECVDDVLLCLWNNIDCFSIDKGVLKNWIIVVAKNKALTYKKKLKKDLQNVELESTQINSNENIEESYLEKDRLNEAMILLNNLDEVDKEIFKARYFEDKSISAIAKDLNLSKMAVYNRLSRGRKKLKKIISDKNIELIL
ncbi:sigma-70 family RNA polymerase sigma factor [Clostridium fungisolvens]|uniref:RNA polymerase subunit sigma-70 n=1 Tax=Clostridium fungisolvens TaxID=1604897 RepID=A0A6V8SLT0_9CLOT|nr:sigma-70 family RNA polymerase sigma factor [Clostridium fungisolvens]GFP75833.1 hypothetical protein bsdtw1_01925 [Clostridium fungisolvens]